MKIKASESFFSPEELQRIASAVESAEKRTSGEIVPVVIERSSQYPEAQLLASILFAALFSLLLVLPFHLVTVWYYIPLTVVLFFPAHSLVRRVPRFFLPFLPRSRMQEAVNARAFASFYENGLHRTADETGVLIFISLFERKVWIVGDRGINSRLDPAVWTAIVGNLTRGIKMGSPADALCTAITECGNLLAAHFPRNLNDENELPDRVISQ